VRYATGAWTGIFQDEVVVQKTAAHFYEGLKMTTVSEAYLRNERHANLHWGADGKAQDMASCFPKMFKNPSSFAPANDLESPIDIRAVVTASRALSSEILLPRILEALISNVLEHAGAERCAVALMTCDALRVEAEASTSSDGIVITLGSRTLDEVEVQAGILLSVARTCQPILLDDVSLCDEFAKDLEVMRRRLRSVLCMPLMNQSELVGVLYMENSLISGAFTAEKMALLEVLVSQAAISLENARLHADTVESSSRRERAEKAQSDSEAELARVASLTTMGQLVASIAHEINQPLASITTSAGAALRWLNRGTPDLAEVSDALQRIQFDSTRAGDIVRGLRALVKGSAPKLESFNLNEAIREVLFVTRGQIHKQRIILDERRIAGDRLVWGDRIQIKQVVLNLVANAIEAMSNVSDRPRCLSLSTNTVQEMVALVVEDSGTSVELDSPERIFAPFVTTNANGLGMELSICRSIVEGHNGHLTVNPRIPYGARFEVVIPASGEAVSEK
jgi:signal transduction histidine kinase